jgi:IS1 family transposase
VFTWIRPFAKEHEEKPEPTGRTIPLEFDEMWHYRKKKRYKLWSWKALDRDTGQLLDRECGRRDKATLKKMIERLAPLGCAVLLHGHMGDLCVGHPPRQAGAEQSDNACHGTESLLAAARVRALQTPGHYFSKSKEMMDLTIALLAKFWVTGNQDELLPLLD